MTQLTPEHFELHDNNKAKEYERKKRDQLLKKELIT